MLVPTPNPAPPATDALLEDVLLPLYRQARQSLGDGPCVVALHLGAQRSGMAIGTGPTPDLLQPLPLGQDSTARQYFRTTPPNALGIEHAIEGVEDVVMPLHQTVPREAQLVSQDAAVREIAVLAGVAAEPAMVLSLEAMERVFDRLAARVQGTPGSQLGLPESNAFAATLVILREFMHHLRFTQVTVLAGVDPGQ